MLIKHISMKNFRQFKEEQNIDFACDSSNNITIIMGENGSGKTTLAQAFLWVLYGKTEFKDKKIINKKAIDEIEVGNSAIVRVDLTIEEDNIEFMITRSQEYIKKNTKLDINIAELQISYKKDGQLKFLKSDECQHFIENILPNELSSFFIFSGERIKNMSEEIQNGKSREFANAVRSLVGLNVIMNSLRHLKGKTDINNFTVLGRYNKKIDESGNNEIKKINRQIEVYENNIKEFTGQIEALKPNLEYYQKESIRLDNEILGFAPAEKMRKQYDFLTAGINDLERDYIIAIKNYYKFFNNNGLSFFLKPAIDSSLIELTKIDTVDKGIPHVHADTINYLIKKGTCMCGNKIVKNSEAHETLKKLLEYLPPKSIGTLINQHKKTSESYKKESSTFFAGAENYFKRIREIDKKIKDKIEEQTNLRDKIIDTANLHNLKLQKQEFEKKARLAQDELENKSKAIGSYQELLSRERSNREKYINIDSKNKKYIAYRNYALELFNILNKEYKNAEISVRDNLEKRINIIFTKILESGLNLNLDENYNIKVSVDELETQYEDIERSTAQNYSVIFAFIAGIIEMAKEKSDEDSKGIFDKAVGYPLIMDAPLSAFDKKRISNICDTIPKIAQQVIFFIKDTDGDVAEKHLGNQLGKKYNVVKESLIVSKIIER